MINNKGQTLILFVIFIPLILILAAFVVDIAYITEKKSHLDQTTELIIKKALKNNYPDKQIKNLYIKNEIDDLANLEIKRTNQKINIKISYYKPSIFGNIIGIKKYKIKTNKSGEIKNNKIFTE